MHHGTRGPDQPRPPWCDRRRAGHGRRRRASWSRSPTASCEAVLRDEQGIDLPPAGAYAVGHGLPPGRPPRRREGPGGHRDDRRRRVARRRGVARRPGRSELPRRHGQGGDAGVRPGLHHRPCGSHGHRARPQGVPRPQAHRARAGTGDRHVLRVAVVAHARLQGDADDTAAGAVLPRPAGRAVRERAAAHPQPLLDQHVPVLAARPPVPLRRPQRRDQHRPGQPELDARPRGDARRVGASRASTGPSRSARRAPRTRPASTRSSSCSTSVAARSTTPC